ncbi:MAG: glucose-6-phosphate dehydrogenase (NADP(+)), partial [Deltaproteobacteria bacterium]|nr:glucose-6-phosphate dehydrogenase (NADP(+)) [Deltaproteobacteria bacterium]
MNAATNPLRQGLVDDRSPEPCTVVIFGASGDLTKRKLVPALFSLYVERLLPSAFAVVGYARKGMSDDAFRAELREWCGRFARHRPTDEQWARFSEGLYFQQGDYEDPAAYLALKERLARIDAERGVAGNRIFYLSTPPATFPVAVQRLAEGGLTRKEDVDGPFTRVVIEKPFGTDLASARALNAHCLLHLREDQIYRIDHYLGKETVQNLMVFRFGNSLFEPLWNNRFVEHVQITGAEAIGIEGRGGYFDQAGIVRDMVQNHLFQVLCLTAMEPPVSMSGDDLR